ncbi:hypothetical protein PIB30_096492 [Stylosanthes scabra]|uniref:Uncharacterized protein n=1 Tax=Stylosanthes scabra TaxID=79078 RepID=A0ABU6QVC9_9FABA|nr:hypothetical protein [Stylosanthes scabra]
MKTKQEEFFSNQVNQYNMIRQDQKLLGKEILYVKKYQMSAVTMGSGSSSSPQPQRYEPDQALMKIREQHANFSEMKNEERKLAEQEKKFGSKSEEELHAYAEQDAYACYSKTYPRLSNSDHA